MNSASQLVSQSHARATDGRLWNILHGFFIKTTL